LAQLAIVLGLKSFESRHHGRSLLHPPYHSSKRHHFMGDCDCHRDRNGKSSAASSVKVKNKSASTVRSPGNARMIDKKGPGWPWNCGTTPFFKGFARRRHRTSKTAVITMLMSLGSSLGGRGIEIPEIRSKRCVHAPFYV
jgi:hypothetical protein